MSLLDFGGLHPRCLSHTVLYTPSAYKLLVSGRSPCRRLSLNRGILLVRCQRRTCTWCNSHRSSPSLVGLLPRCCVLFQDGCWVFDTTRSVLLSMMSIRWVSFPSPVVIVGENVPEGSWRSSLSVIGFFIFLVIPVSLVASSSYLFGRVLAPYPNLSLFVMLCLF